MACPPSLARPACTWAPCLQDGHCGVALSPLLGGASPGARPAGSHRAVCRSALRCRPRSALQGNLLFPASFPLHSSFAGSGAPSTRWSPASPSPTLLPHPGAAPGARRPARRASCQHAGSACRQEALGVEFGDRGSWAGDPGGERTACEPHCVPKLRERNRAPISWEVWLRIVLSSFTYYFRKIILGARKRSPLRQAVWARQRPQGPCSSWRCLIRSL